MTILLFIVVVVVTVVMANYRPPGYFRGDNLWANPADGSYDLAFLELTERGNLYHRELLRELESDVDQRTATLIIVAVHGWHHNAREDDAFVQSFRRLLNGLARSGMVGDRRVLGVYIGWPGRSAPPPISGLTYWPRKSVAEEIGKGGVSEILLRLERAADVGEGNQSGNLSLVVGHSFGGAIVLSALHEILLDRVISAVASSNCPHDADNDTCTNSCVRTEPFGHGIVVLNPAVEANQILQLKELVAENCYSDEQDKLLHVISSETDFTTHKLFPLAQRIRMFGWSEEENLDRQFGNRKIPLSEYDLDRITAGNFEQFWTGRLYLDDGQICRYCTFADQGDSRCENAGIERPESLIPTRVNEPLSFVYSDAGFMIGHSDVFNAQISAYLGAIVIDSMQRKLTPEATIGRDFSHPCSANFDFGYCFESLAMILGKKFEAGPPD